MESDQTITSAGWTRLFRWTKSSVAGSFISDITVSNNGFFTTSTGGIYFFTVNLNIAKADNGQFMISLNLPSSKQSRYLPVAKQEIKDGTGSLSISGSIEIHGGQEICLFVFSNLASSWTVASQSSFSLQLISSFAQSPGFLAHYGQWIPAVQNGATILMNWKSNYQSMTGFSESTGYFVPLVDGIYSCDLNLILYNVSGDVRTFITVNDQRVSSSVKTLPSSKQSYTLHLSRFLALRRTSTVSFELRTTDKSFTVSRETTYSCVLLNKNTSSFLQVLTAEDHVQDFERSLRWIELKQIHYKVTESNRFRYTDNKIYIKDSGYFYVGAVFKIASSKTCSVSFALAIDGSPLTISSNYGILKTLPLVANLTETVSVSAVFQIRSDQYLSIFLQTTSATDISYFRDSVVSIVPVRIRFPSLSNTLEEHREKTTSKTDGWTNLQLYRSNIGEGVHQLNNDMSDGTKIIITETGVYFAAINVVIKEGNESVLEGVLSLETNNKFTNLIFSVNGYSKDINTLNFAGIVSLQRSDTLLVRYTCRGNSKCSVDASSGISVSLLKRNFEAAGFSVVKGKTEKVIFGQNLAGWTVGDGSGTFRSGKIEWNSDRGEFEAAFDAVYYITCNVILRGANLQGGNELKLILKIDNEQHRLKDVKGQSSISKDVTTLGIFTPVSLKKGNRVSLVIKGRGSPNLLIDERSTFSIIALSSVSLSPLAGFSVSKTEDDIVLDKRGQWKTVTNWASGGSFNNDLAYLDFNRYMGTVSLKKSAMVLISISIALTKTIPQPIKSIITLNGKPLDTLMLATDGRSAVLTTMLKFAGLLYLNPGDSISVQLDPGGEGSSYMVSLDSRFSAVVLADVLEKPGMLFSLAGIEKQNNAGWRKIEGNV